MSRLICSVFLLFFIISCTTQKEYITRLNEPPVFYTTTNINTSKELIKEYQRSIIKITEWQKWYNIQVGSNYFQLKK